MYLGFAGSHGTHQLNLHYFVWENSFRFTYASVYEQPDGTNYVRKPRFHCIQRCHIFDCVKYWGHSVRQRLQLEISKAEWSPGSVDSLS